MTEISWSLIPVTFFQYCILVVAGIVTASPTSTVDMTSSGLQAQGCWSLTNLHLHSNGQELLVLLFFLQKIPSVQDTFVSFQMDNQKVV